jgi:hypothetical protein
LGADDESLESIDALKSAVVKGAERVVDLLVERVGSTPLS